MAEGALPVAAAVCPYLGLVAYDVGDAPAFFGREADITACLGRLDEAGVLAVVGPSGSGKSSLIRAGVAAALVRDGNQVRIVTPGPHPEEVLALAPEGAGEVLVVDQCEEVLALVVTAAGAGVVLRRAGRLRLVRPPRLSHCAPTASASWQPTHRSLTSWRTASTSSAPWVRLSCAAPSRARPPKPGCASSPGWWTSSCARPRALQGRCPHLSHVLRQTWRRREGNTLTVIGLRRDRGCARSRRAVR